MGNQEFGGRITGVSSAYPLIFGLLSVNFKQCSSYRACIVFVGADLTGTRNVNQ